MSLATLHDYAASGNCLKVRVLFGLLGRDYRRVAVDIFDGGTLTAEYGALNPLRETPVLATGDGEVVTQSNAILWFLAEGTPFLPADALSRARVVQWLLFEQERVMPGIANPRFRLLTGRAALDPDGCRRPPGDGPRGARHPRRGAGDAAVPRRRRRRRSPTWPCTATPTSRTRRRSRSRRTRR